MAAAPGSNHQWTFHPATPERWGHLEALFGPRGAVGGCWCMWWRLKRSEFERLKGEPNRLALKQIVESGQAPGLLAYAAPVGAGGAAQEQPVGWCAVAPRETFPVLDRSPILKRVDDQPVWSVPCFFIARSYRQQGLSLALLQAALEFAHSRGAHILEGYPEDPPKDNIPDVFAFTGLASTFEKAGFVEVARRSPRRPIMRCTLEQP